MEKINIKNLQKEIKDIDDNLLVQRSIQNKASINIDKLVVERREKQSAINIMRSKNFISDHSIIRYLERVYDFNFDNIKKEIESIKGLREAMALGANKLKVEGKTFVIQNHKVITIY